MKKILLGLIAFVLLCSHIMYLKMDSYFLEPNTPVQIKLFNGTFDKSENVIDRDRMLDVSLLGNGNRIKVDSSQWTEKDNVTLLNFQTGEAGTWVAGVSTGPRSIEMGAEAFNTYLEHEGILDMITWRKENNAENQNAVEKYAKHVKTIFQVGENRSNDWKNALGYPIEFIPLDNPYDLNTGDSLKVKLLFNGQPLTNQLVYADFKAKAEGHSHDDSTEEAHNHDDENTEKTHAHDNVEEHSHDADNEKTHSHEKTAADHSHDTNTEKGHSHDNSAEEGHSHDNNSSEKHSHDNAVDEAHSHEVAESHSHTSGQQLRTNSDGIATVNLTADGIWYIQTINLVNTQEEGFTHESNWTTLTFEVTHAHGTDTHTHDHEDEGEIPSYLYWIGSLLLVGILFFWFNRKK